MPPDFDMSLKRKPYEQVFKCILAHIISFHGISQQLFPITRRVHGQNKSAQFNTYHAGIGSTEQ